LASIAKEFQQAKKDNGALTRYINVRRNEDARKKVDEEAQRKAMVMTPMSDEGQSSKDVCTWRK
jgi:hypothetical protein